MNEWMILTHILQCDTRINMYSAVNGWINEWMTQEPTCIAQWMNEWMDEWVDE